MATRVYLQTLQHKTSPKGAGGGQTILSPLHAAELQLTGCRTDTAGKLPTSSPSLSLKKQATLQAEKMLQERETPQRAVNRIGGIEIKKEFGEKEMHMRAQQMRSLRRKKLRK